MENDWFKDMKTSNRCIGLLARLFGERIETDDGEMVIAKFYKWRGKVYVVDTRSAFNPQLRRAAELLACFLGSLAVYAFLGWQETVVVLLALIMVDMVMLRQRMEEK